MSPSSERRRLWSRAGAAGALAVVGLFGPATAFAVPAGSTTPVVPIETSIVTFAGGTAELDGSTTLERTRTRTRTRTGTRSRIDCTILFAKDSDQLRPGAGEKLHRLAGQLQRQGPGRVKVTGYTDDLGSAAHGLDLSRRRAQQVATALADALPTSTFPMTVRGRGEADPAVPNTSETNRRKNRRVTVILTTTPPPATADPTMRVKPPEPTTQPTTPTPTATAAVPTVEARTPGAEPSTAPAPADPSTAPTPAPTSQPGSTPSGGWPLPFGIGLALILLGALADQVRRRRGPATGTTPDRNPPPKPPHPGDVGAAATTPDAEDSLTAAASTPMPSTASPTTPKPSSTPTPDGSSRRAGNPAVPAVPRRPGVTDLDEDLTAWFSTHTHRPRLTLLGPVHARTHGQALARRKPYYTELLAYLTLKPHGATIDQIADTFTLTTARVRTDMKVLRDWLGTNPTTGKPYLPDARISPAALQRGLPTYQVQNVLCDYHLFTQLHTRATAAAAEPRTSDLETALRLVTGEPFSHTRTNGWHWIFEGNRLDLHAATAILTLTNTAVSHHHENTAQTPAAALTDTANAI